MALTFTNHTTSGWDANPDVAAFNTCVAGVQATLASWVNGSVTSNLHLELNYISSGTGFASNSVVKSVNKTYANAMTLVKSQTPDDVKNIVWTTGPFTADPSGGKDYKFTAAYDAILNNTNSTGQFGLFDHLYITAGFTWDTDPTGTTCGAGKVGLYQALLHEITEIMGRASKIASSTISVIDLCTYSSTSGSVAWIGTITDAGRFFSYDGVNNWSSPGSSVFYQTDAIGDPCDFNATDGFGIGAFSDPLTPTQRDIRVLMAMGLPFSPTGISAAGFNIATVGGIAGFRAHR